MTPEQEQAIRARHVATAISRLSANTGMDLADPERTWCKSDMQRWPCDAAILIAALDDARAEIDGHRADAAGWRRTAESISDEFAERTDERADAIRERLAKATPGPWTEHGRDVDHDRFVAEGRNPGDSCGLGCEVEGPPEANLRGQFHRHVDADFIAHAREDIPALLDALAAVQAERDEARLDRDQRESRRIDTEYDLVVRLAAAEADAAALYDHLRRAIHDLIGDWHETGGPTMRYEEAERDLAAHEARVRR